MKILLTCLLLTLWVPSYGGNYTGWGVHSINMPKKVVGKKEITVGVLDTGIDPTHEFLKGNVIRFLDYSGTGKNDSHGHGTHVSGIIKSVFPDVKLVALKYYNPKFSGSQSLEATMVVAAGNESSNIDNKENAFYPASYGLSNIISVSAHDKSNNLIKSSNWGKKLVDLAAPGKRIKSALPYNRSGFLSGTSQATAFVCGLVALLKLAPPG